MTFPFIKIVYHKSDYKSFVDFWSAYYIYYPLDILYTDRINKTKFNKDDIEKLFEWKNGMKVNGHIQKQASIDKVVSKLAELNKLKAHFNMDQFKQEFCSLGAIWQIYLLHIIQPTEYPIFDQHVYRAHEFLLHKTISEIPKSNPFKLEYYHNTYLPFFNTLKSEISNLRNIDLALWSFGKFLKTHYAELLVADL